MARLGCAGFANSFPSGEPRPESKSRAKDDQVFKLRDLDLIVHMVLIKDVGAKLGSKFCSFSWGSIQGVDYKVGNLVELVFLLGQGVEPYLGLRDPMDLKCHSAKVSHAHCFLVVCLVESRSHCSAEKD